MSLKYFYHMSEVMLKMWTCDQFLVTVAFLLEKLSWEQFYEYLTRKTSFEGGGKEGALAQVE